MRAQIRCLKSATETQNTKTKPRNHMPFSKY
jgi:hypothetical protein